MARVFRDVLEDGEPAADAGVAPSLPAYGERGPTVVLTRTKFEPTPDDNRQVVFRRGPLAPDTAPRLQEEMIRAVATP